MDRSLASDCWLQAHDPDDPGRCQGRRQHRRHELTADGFHLDDCTDRASIASAPRCRVEDDAHMSTAHAQQFD